MLAACGLAGWAPVGFSIVTVFLFAGPHNWFEARYMLGRMPARWGPLRAYFLTGIGGVLALTASFAALPVIARAFAFDEESWLTALAGWNTLLVLWILLLVHLRSRQNPRRDWQWIMPLGMAVIAVNWLSPQAWDLGLVYAHPLVALWFLDRELGKQKPHWRGAYRCCLALLPLFLAVLWWQLATAPNLPGNDLLTTRITQHAGADLVPGLNSHLLVSTHTFLEMLHYGVWLVAIPLVAYGFAPWKLNGVPLAKRSPGWRRVVVGLLAVGAAFTLLIWAGFLANFPLTRDVYFTVAMLHVLAEVPFLLRLL